MEVDCTETWNRSVKARFLDFVSAFLNFSSPLLKFPLQVVPRRHIEDSESFFSTIKPKEFIAFRHLDGANALEVYGKAIAVSQVCGFASLCIKCFCHLCLLSNVAVVKLIHCKQSLNGYRM